MVFKRILTNLFVSKVILQSVLIRVLDDNVDGAKVDHVVGVIENSDSVY